MRALRRLAPFPQLAGEAGGDDGGGDDPDAADDDDAPPADAAFFAALDCEPGELPTGLLVGTATIDRCTGPVPAPCGGAPFCRWHLSDVQRLPRPRQPTGTRDSTGSPKSAGVVSSF